MKRVLFSILLCIVLTSSVFSISMKTVDEVHSFDSVPMLDAYYDESEDSNMKFWDGCKVSLLTIGAGGPLYSWFGHSAFLVETPDGRSYVYDYGTFSFNADNFIGNFVMGRLWFMCFGTNAHFELEYIKEEGRRVSQVVLPLDAAQKKAVVEFLNINVEPDNRTYLYHHYNDNCSTRIRDIINRTTDDAFRLWAEEQKGLTYRQQASRALCQNRFVLWSLDFLQSGNIDGKATLWDEMFLPENLERAVMEFYGLENEIIVEGSGKYTEMVEKPQDNVLFSAILGFALGLISFVLIWFGKERANYIYSAIVDFFFGILGSILLFMMFFTNHDVTWFNENLIFVNPYLIVLGVFSLLALRRKGSAFKYKKLVNRSYMVLVGVILLLALFKILMDGIFDQQNWSIIFTMLLFYLPNWFNMKRYKIFGKETESDMNLTY